MFILSSSIKHIYVFNVVKVVAEDMKGTNRIVFLQQHCRSARRCITFYWQDIIISLCPRYTVSSYGINYWTTGDLMKLNWNAHFLSSLAVLPYSSTVWAMIWAMPWATCVFVYVLPQSPTMAFCSNVCVSHVIFKAFYYIQGSQCLAFLSSWVRLLWPSTPLLTEYAECL